MATKIARVVFDYKGEEERELDVCLGDLITILKEDESGWTKAQLSDGREGWLPQSYYESCDQARLPQLLRENSTNSPRCRL